MVSSVDRQKNSITMPKGLLILPQRYPKKDKLNKINKKRLKQLYILSIFYSTLHRANG